MKTLFPLLFFLVFTLPAFSQNAPGIRIPAGHSFSECIPVSQRMRYAQFQDGRIYFNDGKISVTGKFNYDMVNGRMLFIQSNGDTVPVVNRRIDFFKIKDDVFLNLSRDIVEVVNGDQPIRLGINVKYVLKRTERIVGHETDQVSSNININPSSGARYPSIEDEIIVKSITYYISIGGTVKTFKATRQKILKNFALNKQQIEKYFDENKPNLSLRSDLERLVAYLNSIIGKRVS
jgi:hypothetical protein